MSKKAPELTYGKLKFSHKPLTLLVLLDFSDPELELKDAIETFCDFVNENGLSKNAVTVRDVAKQGSRDELYAFINEWQALEGEQGNSDPSLENSSDS